MAPTPFKIYGLHTPMFIKTVLAAEELGLDYEVVPVDLTKGETRTPEHAARHPFGKVPVLEHQGNFLFESNAIVRYLGASSSSALYPTAAWERAVVDQWIDYFALQAGRWCTGVWFQTVIAPKFFGEQPDATIVRDYSEALLGAMPVIDQHLAKNPWLAGANPTLADTVAYVLMHGFAAAGFSDADFPNFKRWTQAYAARPAVEKVYQRWG